MNTDTFLINGKNQPLQLKLEKLKLNILWNLNKLKEILFLT